MKALPEIVERRIGTDAGELVLRVTAGCPWFEGHFPAHAILPGVVQIGWAAHFAAEIFVLDGGVLALERVKFKRIIEPDALLTLQLARNGLTVRYNYRDGDLSCSSGQLRFGGTA